MAEGTPADLTRVVDISKVKGGQPSAIREILGPLADGLREQGYKWFRITAPSDDEDHVYMQAWRLRPEIEGALDRSAAVSATPEQK
jgi:hypothetical protein